MLHPRSLALALLLAPALAPLVPAPAAPSAPQRQDVTGLLRERAAAARELDDRALWQEAAALADLSLEFEEGEMERAIDALLTGAEPLAERGRLLLAATRAATEAPPYDLLARVLAGLVDADDPGVVRAAAAMLSDARFKNASDEALEEAGAKLLAGAGDLERDPRTRLELAVAAWKRGGGREKREARGRMKDFLASSDAELRGLAALALARIGDYEEAGRELERLARLPGAEGRLAEAFLKLEGDRRFYEGKLAKQREVYQESLEGRGAPEDLDRVDRLIEMIETSHVEGDRVKRAELLDAALDGMLRSLDAHSSYLSAKEYGDFQQDLEGEYGGIGAYVEVDPDDNIFTITRPIYSGPAYHANLRSDDKIVRVDDWPTLENGQSKDQNEIIRRLKGKPGTEVKLYIWRRGMDPSLISRPTEDMAVTIERKLITIPPMRSELLPGDIGLVELSTFSGVASQELGAILRKMKAQGVKAVVFDLRNNSGGLLDEAQGVADLFLPRGELVVTTEERLREPTQLYTRRDPIVPEDLPVALLVNRFSASASEIVAGALQDHGRAKLVGERTYGKGTVQHLIPLGDDDRWDDENGNRRWDNWERITLDHDEDGEFDFAPRAKLTIARWLTPSGQSIHRELDEEGQIVRLGGIQPDVEVSARRWDAWRLELMRELIAERRIREWVGDQWAAHRELFEELAYGDGKDPGRYPGFEELYEGLQTVLPKEDVRYLVRSEIRRRVQDERGSAFPQGDYQEDTQLQAAIEAVLGELGRSPYELEPYLLSFDNLRQGADQDAPGARIGAAEPDAERRAVRDALALLARAERGEVQLTPESLERIRELLTRLDR